MAPVYCDRCAHVISLVDTQEPRVIIGGVAYRFHDACWTPIAGPLLALLTGHRNPAATH